MTLVDVPVPIWGESDLRWRGQVTLIMMPWRLYGELRARAEGIGDPSCDVLVSMAGLKPGVEGLVDPSCDVLVPIWGAQTQGRHAG